MNHFQLLIQALPQNFEQLALNCNAFLRARKIKSPLELFKLLMLYCGVDLPLRSCAGKFDQTVQEAGAKQTSYQLHLGIDLLSLSMTDAVVSTDKAGENLQHYQLQEGNVYDELTVRNMVGTGSQIVYFKFPRSN